MKVKIWQNILIHTIILMILCFIWAFILVANNVHSDYLEENKKILSVVLVMIWCWHSVNSMSDSLSEFLFKKKKALKKVNGDLNEKA